MAENLKNLFVFVPAGNAIEDFKTNHTGSTITSSDKYFDKIAFLSGTGQMAARGELFGMSKDFSDKIGLTDDITTSNTLMTYITSLGSQLDVLNDSDSNTGSVDYKIKQAVDGLVGAAPQAYDTIYEIAAWLQEINTQHGTAAAVANTLSKVPVIESKLGSYVVDNGVGTYYGAYLFAHNAAIDAATNAVNGLSISSPAVQGQYISEIALTNGAFTITRASLPELSLGNNTPSGTQYISGLSVSGHTITATYATVPTLSIANGSGNYLTVNDHEVGVQISSISSSTGITYSTTYTVGTETIGNGLITASNVYDRVHATEEYVASALNTLDARIASVVAGATDLLDAVVTSNATENGTSYGSITIVQQNGKIVSGDGTNTTALTINRTAILAEASATVDSPTTGTGANEYIQVHVTEENHKVTGVTVDFDPWEVYTPSQP